MESKTKLPASPQTQDWKTAYIWYFWKLWEHSHSLSLWKWLGHRIGSIAGHSTFVRISAACKVHIGRHQGHSLGMTHVQGTFSEHVLHKLFGCDLECDEGFFFHSDWAIAGGALPLLLCLHDLLHKGTKG